VQQQPDLIKLFIAPLNQTGVDYMVTGAVAAIVYGEPRLTNDIDIVIDLSAEDLPRLLAAYPLNDFYVPPLEVLGTEIARLQHGHFNIIHTPSSLKADFYPVGEDSLHQWAIATRRGLRLFDENVMIAPPEYVVIRKLEYYRAGGSDRHLRDIRAMLRVSEEQIDRSLILRFVAQRNLEKEWEAVLSQ
jgi:hypothetical protein